MTAAEGAIRTLETLVASGRFPPGSRLPIEAELAAELNISRSTLREAVRALTQAGLFDVRQGDGSYVATMNPCRLFGGLRVHSQVATGNELDMILEARMVLEPQMAKMACERGTSEQFTRLGELFKSMDGAADDDFIVAEITFVANLVQVASSPLLAETATSVALASARLRRLSRDSLSDYRSTVTGYHHQLIDALAERNCEAAAKVTAQRLADSERWMRA